MKTMTVGWRTRIAAVPVDGLRDGERPDRSWLLRACASLGIKLVHSAPGRPP